MIDGEKVHVPYTLPGEKIHLRAQGNKGRLLELIEPSKDRAEPFCPHFGTCGGCALQHANDKAYEAFKTDVIATNLTRHNVTAPKIEAPYRSGKKARRRAGIGFAKTKDGAVIGFKEKKSHRLVSLDSCPLLTDRINALLPALQKLSGHIKGSGSFFITETDSGIDLCITQADAPSLELRERYCAFAEEEDIARISVKTDPIPDAEPILMRDMPLISFEDISAPFPAASFLQPTKDSETFLTDFAKTHLAGAGKIADLFCGLGTFSLPLAKAGKKVAAFDCDPPAMQVLQKAATQNALPVTATKRDLFRDPLTAKELDKQDALLLDPPRAGAMAQTQEIAKTKTVGKLVYISCNPQTFARDAAILQESGFTMTLLQPVDQFPYSPHVELAAVFTR